MKKNSYLLLLFCMIFSSSLWGTTSTIDVTGMTNTQVNAAISSAVSLNNTDVILQFPAGSTYNYAGVVLTVPTGVTKLTFTATGSGTMPVINLDQLSFSDGSMIDGLYFEGVKLYTTYGTSKYLFQPTTNATNVPKKLSINNCWIEGYRAVYFLSTITATISNVTITNSTFKNIGPSGIISVGGGSTTSNISITNNTFIDCNIAGAYFIDFRQTVAETTTFNFSNNTYYLSSVQGNGAFRLNASPTTAGHYTFNNNIFAGGTATAFKFGYGNYSNIAGTGNYYIQNFNAAATYIGSSTPNVAITQYNVSPTTFFKAPNSNDFTINDVSFPGKTTTGNANNYYPATITLTGGTIVNLDYNVGNGPSIVKSFTFVAYALRSAITITAPSHYEISTDNSTFYDSSTPITLGSAGADLTSQTIYVRLKAGLAIGKYDESISFTSTGTSASASLSGSVTNPLPLLDTPTGLTTSAPTYTSFHASWTAVANTTIYTLRLLLNGATVSTIPNVNATSYDFTNLTPGGNYSFAVTAVGDALNYNNSGESLVSSVVALPYIYLLTSINTVGAGTITRTPNTTTYSPNASVQLTATKNFGYVFVNWIDSVSGNVLSSSTTYNVTMNETKHIQAVFNAVNTYKLSVAIAGGAKDYMVVASPAPTIVNGNNMYEAGTVVTLTASNNSILTFANWSDGSTNAALSLTMNQDQSTTATYSAVDYIVGWDFYKTGNGSRPADFYSTTDNSTANIIMRNAAGTINSWLDKSVISGSYYNRGAAVNWQPFTSNFYYQTNFVATDFTDIKVTAGMLYNYNAFQKQNVEYSLDGTNFTSLASGTYTLTAGQTWFDKTVSLPSNCDHAAKVYVRWIPDYTSSIVGSSSGNDGTSLSAVYITGTKSIVNDGLAPTLSSSVPTSNGTGASATGKVILNFSKNVQLVSGTTATIGSKTISPTISGKTINFSYSGLSYNTQYTFTLAANTVSDIFGNTLSTPVTFTFTTMNRPTISKKAFDFVVGVDGNFAAALAAATTASSSGNRFRIFFPDGNYNIGATTGNSNQMTTITLPNISLIGQSSDNVILYNQNTTEGISSSATLYFTNSANNQYLQDLTLKNKDYRSGVASLGRCVALQDHGTKNIYKNVNVLSNQDTYYSGIGRYYFEGGSIHGTVDFLCGGGDAFFNECLIYLEDRSGNCITAPSTTTNYGYIFNNCTIDGFSSTNGNFSLGRPWQNAPRAVYLNTTMKVLPTSAGWADMGTVPALFAEYNSTTSLGAAVDVSSRKTSYSYGTPTVTTTVTYNPVLSANDAASYTIDNVLGGNDTWQPNVYTDQAAAPTITGSAKAISWDNNDYVLCWGVFKNGQFVQFVTNNNYTIPDDVSAGAVYTVRAANEMGGLSASSNSYTYDVQTSVNNAKTGASIVSQTYFTISGERLNSLDNYVGVAIMRTSYSDGRVVATKVIRTFKQKQE